MTPGSDGMATYWAAGGDIVSRRGALSIDRARELFAFHGRTALARHAEGDLAAARFCALQALELARAIAAADDWGRASTGEPARQIALRQLACEVSDFPYG
jgi:hypothetical protein